MTRTVICVSHTIGAGGADLGRFVAERLSFRLVDEEIVARAAEDQNVKVEDLSDVERRKSLLTRIVRELAVRAAKGPGGEANLVIAPDLQSDKDSLRALIRQSINETADEGDVVIVSHAASYALADRATVLRVLVTAPPETRARRLVESNDLDEKEAVRSVSASDAGRADYLKRFYGVAEELPTHYDLVINTERVPAERWPDIVVDAAAL